MRLLLFAWLWIHDPESRQRWNPYDREVGRGKYFFGQANTGDLLQKLECPAGSLLVENVIRIVRIVGAEV